jgi:cysteine desulfurase
MRRIYLDFNASTPIHPAVAEAMRAAPEDGFGNPSSRHWAGAAAKELLEAGRRQIADLLGCLPSEVVLTSGGSEANNLAIKGVFFAQENRAAHIVSTQIEHPSVLAPLSFLERAGARISYLRVDSAGLVDPDDLRRALARDTVLVSIMHANNETGTIQPIEACARIARERGILFHTDAAQSMGKIAADVDELGVDLLSVAGHKLYAPKGVGALYVRSGTRLEPLIHGAAHEGGRRAGTESAVLAAALGTACSLVRDSVPLEGVRRLRDEFWESLNERFGARVVRNGHAEQCLPNTLNVSFVGSVGADLLAALDGVAASTGSACHEGRVELSPVLRALNVPEHIGKGAVRFSLGRETTADELADVVERLSVILRLTGR